jgi:hypothetical protein
MKMVLAVILGLFSFLAAGGLSLARIIHQG